MGPIYILYDGQPVFEGLHYFSKHVLVFIKETHHTKDLAIYLLKGFAKTQKPKWARVARH